MNRMAIGPRLRRAVEFFIVTIFAFGIPLWSSVYGFLHPSVPGEGDDSISSAPVIVALCLEVLSLALLLYITRREGSFRRLGVSIRWKDLPGSLAIAVTSYVVFYLIFLLIYFSYALAANRELSYSNSGDLLRGGLTGWTLVLVLLNPLYEELIVRAYVISEVQFLAGSTVLAVALSVGIQGLYHLYQGLAIALADAGVFLLWSIYYVRSKRIIPIVLAHMYLDLIALLLRT